MLKPLTQEQIDKIINTAIQHFADRGFAGANVNKIASAAGVSVGVVYKYYKDKQDLFLACVRKSLDYLDQVYNEIQESGGGLMEQIENLIAGTQRAAREHPEYFQLYHQITVSGAPVSTAEAAELIEGQSARLYRQILQGARDAGDTREDMDPSGFAFFFDNLLMMLHFSYACGYYRDRYQVFCGDEIGTEESDRKLREQMMKFIAGGLGAPEA